MKENGFINSITTVSQAEIFYSASCEGMMPLPLYLYLFLYHTRFGEILAEKQNVFQYPFDCPFTCGLTMNQLIS